MEPFAKTCHPGHVRTGGRLCRLFVRIKFNGKELSITGVEGPKPNGDAIGACGQIVMHPWDMADYAPGWNADRVAKLRDVWDEWHLNSMRPYDAAMRADGWHELAALEVYGHEFTLTSGAFKDKKDAEGAASAALRNGQTFTPSPEQVTAAVRPYSVTVWQYTTHRPEAPEGYEPARSIRTGDVKSPERKTLGWLRPSEHPDGLLTKVHPKSGNGYGCKWYHADVPEDVLEWLKGLPEADVKPAWV